MRWREAACDIQVLPGFSSQGLAIFRFAQELETQYTQIFALEGTVPVFPQTYPPGVLLGCVEVVDCLSVGPNVNFAPPPPPAPARAGAAAADALRRPEREALWEPFRSEMLPDVVAEQSNCGRRD